MITEGQLLDPNLGTRVGTLPLRRAYFKVITGIAVRSSQLEWFELSIVVIIIAEFMDRVRIKVGIGSLEERRGCVGN